MPMYEFKCPECGLRFEKLVHDKNVKSHNCLSCGALSTKELSSFGFVFGSGKTPGNTGVDSLDSSVDKGVGRDAARRWEAVKDRNSYKRRVQRDNGEEGKVPLKKNPHTGEYEAMKDTEVGSFQKLHSEYASIYDEHKQERQAQGISKFSEDDPYARYRNQNKEQKKTNNDGNQ